MTGALDALSEAVDLARALGDETAIAHNLGNLGLALTEHEQFDLAREAYREQLALARQLRDRESQAVALGGICGAALCSPTLRPVLRRTIGGLLSFTLARPRSVR